MRWRCCHRLDDFSVCKRYGPRQDSPALTQFRIDARIPAGALISEGYIVRKFIALVIALLVLLSAGAPALAQAVGPAPVVTLSIMPSISSLAFGPGDRWFVTGGWDNTVKIWETSSGRCFPRRAPYRISRLGRRDQGLECPDRGKHSLDQQ